MMKQGNIILVPFPFTDLSSQKTRPALVISKRKMGDDVIAVAITSKKYTDAIPITNDDLVKGALPVTSYIRYEKVVTLHQALIKKTVAELKPKTLRGVLRKFKMQF